MFVLDEMNSEQCLAMVLSDEKSVLYRYELLIVLDLSKSQIN